MKTLSRLMDSLQRLLGKPQHKQEMPTEDEVTDMIRESTDAGVFEKTEYDIAARALRLDDWHLHALMTPRVDLEFLDLGEPLEATLARIAEIPFARFPVYRGDRSQVLGIVNARDLFRQAIRRGSLQQIDIEAELEEPLYVPDSVSAIDLLEQLKKNHAELAMIVDEYGDIQGMITLTDVMTALVGEVPAVEDEDAPDAVQRDDGSWLMDAGMVLDRFRYLTGAALHFPDEGSDAYHTLAGFVLYQLGYIPKAGDKLDWEGWRFEVVDMDGNRIDQLLVMPAAPATSPAPA